jgi:hypothetical protein
MIIIINNKQRIGEINRKMFFHAHEETQRGYGFDRIYTGMVQMCKGIVM